MIQVSANEPFGVAPHSVENPANPRSMMNDVSRLVSVGAVLSWGAYGVMLHQGQVLLGNPLKALLCVGVAYFLVGVVVVLIVTHPWLALTVSAIAWNAA